MGWKVKFLENWDSIGEDLFSLDEEHNYLRAKVTYHKAYEHNRAFQDRLSYIDKRYDHIRKLAHALRKKVNELEDIMALDNDEENMDTIQRLLAEIKREKQVIRDEVHVIKGELSTAMYNEDLRTNILNFLEQFEEWWYEDPPEKRLTGEWRRLKMEQSTEEELEEMREQERDTEKRPSTGSSGATYRETSF